MAELHDFINEDLAKLYPNLMPFVNITVYDVAPTVLPMFDESLGKYAMKHFSRQGINIKTSHHISKLRKGLPDSVAGTFDAKDEAHCLTLDVKEEGQVGVGLVVWSTGLMMNPFVKEKLGQPQILSVNDAQIHNMDNNQVVDADWLVKRNDRTGSIVTDEHLRVIMEPKGTNTEKGHAVMNNVFALGDCATMEASNYPATAQVAAQKAEWLAKQLNKGGLVQGTNFHYHNLGIMAYIGDWNAIFQGGGGGNVSGRTAWLLWRGAYLTKSVSWRNKVLIPMYWFLNWLFGRDITRF